MEQKLDVFVMKFRVSGMVIQKQSVVMRCVWSAL